MSASHPIQPRCLGCGTGTRDTIYAPESRRLVVTEPMRAGTWTPAEPGVYELRIGPAPDMSLVQRWEVLPATPAPGR